MLQSLCFLPPALGFGNFIPFDLEKFEASLLEGVVSVGERRDGLPFGQSCSQWSSSQ